ncbi:MAG: hypothetical protein M5R38_09325 [Candidatus Methylomirabilis sp.]|nr:hypothetical protein [Candidatus Methylomirabilis sp.]
MEEKLKPDPAQDTWSMSQEREFMEKLLCSRFNFFLVFFSLVINAAVSATDARYFKIVLTLGTLISIPLALTIVRAQMKLNVALNDHLFQIKRTPGPDSQRQMSRLQHEELDRILDTSCVLCCPGFRSYPRVVRLLNSTDKRRRMKPMSSNAALQRPLTNDCP